MSSAVARAGPRAPRPIDRAQHRERGRAHAPESRHVSEIRGHRRQRPRLAPQHAIAAQMVAFRQDVPYAFVLMLGDNIYEGPATREDYRLKFEEPYRRLLDDGVKFYAVLGNHDDPREVSIRHSTWMESGTTASRRPKICWRRSRRAWSSSPSTRPISIGRSCAGSTSGWPRRMPHGRCVSCTTRSTPRVAINPRHACFVCCSSRCSSRHGVDAVFSGHEHIYQRSDPAVRHPVFHQRRRRIAATRRRLARRRTSRGPTIATITSC